MKQETAWRKTSLLAIGVVMLVIRKTGASKNGEKRTKLNSRTFDACNAADLATPNAQAKSNPNKSK